MDPHDQRQAGNSDTAINGPSESPFAYDYLHQEHGNTNMFHCGHDDVFASPASRNADGTDKIDYDQHHHPPITMTAVETDVGTHSSGSASGAPTVSRRRKKPKGFPKRPLSGYNIFFKEERVKVLQEFSSGRVVPAEDEQGIGAKLDRSSVSFQELGKIVGKRWKTLSEGDRRRFENLADLDNLRYRGEMDEYNDAKRKRNEEKILRIVDDDVAVEDSHHSLDSSSKWSTMVLTRPQEIHHSFYPYGRSADDHQRMTEDWRSDESTNHGPSKTFSYPIAPGTELTLPDHHGTEQRYRVDYTFIKMTRRDAETYMAQLAQTPTVTPYGFTDYPPPPPGATFVQDPNRNHR